MNTFEIEELRNSIDIDDTIATIEHTDTFGGEANYCWATRHAISTKGLTDLQVVRRLKKAIDLNGAKAVKHFDTGDCVRYDLVGLNQCFFITYSY